MSNGPPPLPPGARPMPPPRRIEPSPTEANPFMVPEPVAQAPTPEPPSGANPFLASDPTPAPASQAQAPRIVPPSPGAPLRVQPGAVAPNVRDAHAEFRKGSLKKPLLFTVVAAAIAGGLFFGLPAQVEEKAAPFAEPSDVPAAVIGASVSPEVIPDPDRPSLQNPNPERRRLRDEEPAAAPVEQRDRSEGFGDAFKSSAQ